MPTNLPPVFMPLHKQILFKIKALLLYPWKVSNMYSAQMYGISQIIAITEMKSNFDPYLKWNNRNKWLYIWSPMMLGLVSAIIIAYTNKANYIRYYNDLRTPVVETRITSKISSSFKKVSRAVTQLPFSKDEVYIFLAGYVLSIIGAKFASQNPAFKHQADIQINLQHHGKVDMNGNPWMVIWTREALFIKSWNCDPSKLVNDMAFFSDINFPPTAPKIDKKNMNQFVILKKQELNPKMIFNFNTLLSKISHEQNQEQQPTEVSEVKKEKTKKDEGGKNGTRS